MNKYGFNVVWSDEDEGYIATCPEFPGLSAFGETAEVALLEAQSALDLFIKTYNDDGLPLPQPQAVQQYSGQTRLRLSKSLHRQAALMAQQDEMSLNQFLADAVRAKVTGEQVAAKALTEVRKCLNETRTQAASVMTVAEPVARYTHKTHEISTEQTVFVTASGEGKKGN